MSKLPDAMILDLTYFRSITNGNEALEARLIDLFRKTAERCVASLGQALESNNAEIWKAAAHELKGSSAYLGAIKLKEICFDAEQMGLSLGTPAVEQIRHEIARVYSEIQVMLPFKG